MSIRDGVVRRWFEGHEEATPTSAHDQGDPTMTEPRVIHFEILGKDGPALQRYWGDLLGWKLNTDNPGGYGMTDPADTGIVVGVSGTQDGSAGHVTSYVRVADIDATLARAVELGGSVVMPKFSPSPDATLALVADPEGHVVGLSE
jgi:predicted enzyme related to lactoylglutathione lyase